MKRILYIWMLALLCIQTVNAESVTFSTTRFFNNLRDPLSSEQVDIERNNLKSECAVQSNEDVKIAFKNPDTDMYSFIRLGVPSVYDLTVYHNYYLWISASQVEVTLLNQHAEIESIKINYVSNITEREDPRTSPKITYENFSMDFPAGKTSNIFNFTQGSIRVNSITVNYHFNHKYGETGVAYYTCQQCGREDEARKAACADRALHLTAVGGDVTIGMKKTGNPANYLMQYSLDKQNWTATTLTATTDIVTIPAGQTCYFRHGGDTPIEHIAGNQNNCWSFTMTGEGTIEAGGNVMSMLDIAVQKSTLSATPQHAFTGLFKDCDKLTVAPELPATTIGQFCYMYMFAGTSITEAPSLPATTIPDGAYYGMFQDCKILTTVPALPGTALSRVAYKDMFHGCETLTSVEIANITTISNDNPFTDWLTGTAVGTTGLLIASLDGLCNAKIPSECIPSNWQWATKLKANQDPSHPSTGYYTTFYDSRYAYTLPSCVKAYTATIEEDGDKVVMLTAIKDPSTGSGQAILPKGVAVLLHSTTTGEMLLAVSSENGIEPAENLFSGVDVETAQTGINYMLSYGQDGLAFYKMKEGMMLSANKAFLPQTATMANALAFRMVFEDEEETGIENINDNDTLRYDNDNIYSVSGIRLNKLLKGINIVNGKKIIVK